MDGLTWVGGCVCGGGHTPLALARWDVIFYDKEGKY